MKYIKIYESFQKELKIDLLLLCEYVDGLYNAIEILKKLSSNCSRYEILYHNHILEDPHFDHTNVPYKMLIDKSKTDAIKIEGNKMSYGYLLSNKKNNLYFIFYDVVDDQNINTMIVANKYNL